MNTVTPAQSRFIASLVAERDLDESLTAEVEEARTAYRAGAFTKVWASYLITALQAAPKKEAAPTSANTGDVPEGMHVYRGNTYKVQVAKNGSGRKYAKALENLDGKWRFVYAPGIVGHLSTETQMDTERAAQFGHLYGICVNCAADLTDERSIAVGYGPICAERNGWEWGAYPAVEVAG